MSNNEGLYITQIKAKIAFEELASWIASLTPDERLNLLHIGALGRITGTHIEMMLRLRRYDYETQTRRKKAALERKEKEELQAEEAIVRSLMTGG